MFQTTLRGPPVLKGQSDHVVLDSACHAGGCAIESHRSRHTESPGGVPRQRFIAVISPTRRVCCPIRQQTTTRVLHRLCPAVAGRSRSQPGRAGTKCLLQPVIQGGSRLCRLSSYRPVTPEVAGSSPVAPAKVPANRHVVLSDLTPKRRRLHGLFSKRRRKRRKRPEMRSRSDDFKPIQAEFRPATKAACDYTKRPEVTAAANAPLRCSPLGRPAPEPGAHER